MLWLLPYVGYALAASAVASAAGYAAVTQFSVIQRVLAMALDRTLSKLAKADDGTPSYRVEHTETGVIASGVVVGRAALKNAQAQGTRVASLSIQRLEVNFPSLSSPVSVKIQGIRVRLQQLQLPEHVSPEARAAAERAQSRDDKLHRLEVVEELLWGQSSDGKAAGRRWNPAGAYLGRLQARALQKSLAFIAQLLHLEVSDIDVQYTQRGEPGPRPSINYLQGADAAVLHVRAVTLVPRGALPGPAVGPAAAAAMDDLEGGSGNTTPLGSPRKAQAPTEEPTWWAALASIPHLLWSNVVITQPSATELLVTGVSLVLRTYPSTWEGYHAAQRSAAQHAQQQQQPFAFTFGGREPIMPGTKRRRRASAAGGVPPTGTNSAFGGGVGGAAAAASSSSTAAAAPAAAAPPLTAGEGWTDDAEALRAVPSEDHVIFRQWEFSIMLCLLPPGYNKVDAYPGAAPPTPARPAATQQPSTPPESPRGRQASSTQVEQIPASAEATMSRRGSSYRLSLAGSTGSLASPFEAPQTLEQLDSEMLRQRTLEHLVSGGFEEFDADVLEANGLSSPSPSPPPRRRSGPEEDEEIAPAGVVEEESSGGSVYGTPTALTPATSRSSSRPSSPERTPTPPFFAAVAAQNGTHPPPQGSDEPSTPVSPSAAASSPRGGAHRAQHEGPGAFTVDVALSLKALILEVNASSCAILNRVVDRQSHFSHFGEHWAVRPEDAVEGHEAVWWQHGGRAISARSCRMGRREVPLQRLELRRAARLQYQALYAGVHVNHRQFVEPGRRWWQLRRVKAADETARRRLEDFEAVLSLEELSHFRFGVAAIHNRLLAENEPLMHLVADKIDALVYTRPGPMAPGLADLLLHRDRQPTAASTSGSAPSAPHAMRFGLQVSVACPKLGVAMDMRPAAAADPTSGVDYVVLALRGVSAELNVDGGIDVQVAAMDCGQCEAPTSFVHPRILACPSTVCERVCWAAEFTRYAMTGSVIAQSGAGGLGEEACGARLEIRPRYGKGGMAVGETGVRGLGEDGADFSRAWRPAGFDIEVQLAAVGLVYNGPVASALLEFAASWNTYKTQPWVWTTPPQPSTASEASVAAAAAPPPQEVRRWPPPLPEKPVSVDEMVENAFATAQEPVLGRLVLPSTNLNVRCPGVAVQLPYRHKNSPDMFKGTGRRRATRRLQEAAGEEGGERAADGVDRTAAKPPLPPHHHHQQQQQQEQQDQQPSPLLQPQPHPDAAHSVRTGGASTDADEEGPTDAAAAASGEEDANLLTYMFTVTLQNIEFSVQGEDFDLSLRGGTTRRIQALGYLDIFSYLSRTSRRGLAKHIMPARIVFDPARRQFTGEVAGVDALEQELREIELVSMAKVWSYPEDMPIIMRKLRKQQQQQQQQGEFGGIGGGPFNSDGVGIPAIGVGVGAYATRRTPSMGLDAASGLAQIMPELLKSPDKYPIPLLPYLKVGAAHSDVVQRLTATPDEPGGAVLAAATNVFGVQAWVSPLHVWHLVSLEGEVRRIVNYTMGSSLLESVAERKAEEKAKAAAGVATPQLPVPRARRRFMYHADVQEISLLWLIGTWTSKGQAAGASDPGRYSRAWGITVKRGDPAYLWAQWLAPVYGVSLAKVGAAVGYHPSGAVVAGASVDGIIVRDLQLPDGAKHAYVLRPLPARARRLNHYVIGVRRVLLGVVSVSPARTAWDRGIRKVLLRQHTSLAHTTALLQDPSGVGMRRMTKVVLGPQLAVWYCCTPPGASARGPPSLGPPKPQEEIRVEVGQLLAYVRVKQHASMTVFAQQLTQITRMITAESGSGGSIGAAAGEEMAATEVAPGLRLQTGLRVDIVLVGIDVLFRVESRDLMSLKLQQGSGTVDRKAVTTSSGPKDIRLHMSAAVQDIMIQDLRAGPEHTLVLIPNGDAGYCSFDAIYSAQVDSRQYAPCLILEVQNPRILLLFRFLSDITNAVGIISGAVTRNAAGTPRKEAAAAAAAATTKSKAAAAEKRPGSASQASKPLEIVVQVQNAGIVVPTGSTTRTVLAGQVSHVMLAVPGKALPSQLLEEAELPSLEGMVEESLLSNTTFKFGGFHDPTPATAAAAAAAAAHRPRHEASAPQQQQRASEAPAAPAPAVAAGTTARGEHLVVHLPQPSGPGMLQPGEAPGIKRAGIFNQGRRRPPRKEDRSGVLYFEEEEENPEDANPAGVLHVTMSGREADDEGDLVDNVLLGPGKMLATPAKMAQGLATAFKSLMEQENGDPIGWVPAEVRPQVVAEPVAAGKCGGAGPSSQPQLGAAGAAQQAAAQRDGDGDSVTTGPDTPPDLPSPAMALCIEEFTVVTGSLVRVPNYFLSAKGQRGEANPRQGSFVPASLTSFSWPSEVYEVVSRNTLLQRTNISMVQFQREYPECGTFVSQLHLSSTPLSLVLSAPNYTTIMDFVAGNLADLSKPPPGVPPPPPPRHKETTFNPSMKFGPPAGMAAKFRFTLAVPRLGMVLEAHPREWTDVEPTWEYLSAAEAHLLRPFLHGAVSNVLMDLGSLPNGDTHIKICATSLDLQDLRMGYRLTEISSKVPHDVEYEAAHSPRPVLHRWGVALSEEEAAARASYLAARSSQAQGSSDMDFDFNAAAAAVAAGAFASSPSAYGSPAESPMSAGSWNSGADTPQTPEFAFIQAPGLRDEIPTPGLPTVSSSGQFVGAGEATAAPATRGPPQTGIRLSVSRRLSEHSQRQRDGSRDRGDGLPQGSHGAPTPGRAPVGGTTPRQFLPVLDFSELPEVRAHLGEEVASLRVLTAPHHAPPEERPVGVGAASTRLPGSNPNVRLEVSVAVLADRTTAVEVALSAALLQWPYFHDYSLISSIANVFKSACVEEREACGEDVPVVADKPAEVGPSHWLYVNTILTETEIFLPVIDAEVAEHMVAELWGVADRNNADNSTAAAAAAGGFVAGGGSGSMSLPSVALLNRNSFQRIADLALASMLLDSSDVPGALALEERGLAVSASAIRVSYAAGGDGEMVVRVDLRELAAFIRDPWARVNCVLHPFSCSAEIMSQVPEAAEQLEVERLNRAAITIQREWRRTLARRKLRTRIAGQQGAAAAAVANYTHRPGVRRLGASRASVTDDRGKQWRLVDELVLDVASPHTRSLLVGYKRASKDRSNLMFMSQFLTTSTTSVNIKAGALTVRAAFSHIPFWQSAVDGVRRVILNAPQVAASPAPSARDGVGTQKMGVTSESRLEVGAKPFRPHSIQVTATLENSAIVLCNDKPETFGAPDVLQVSLCEASLAFDAATMMPDRPANKAGRLALSTYASFLNSGTSRWEALYDMWPISADFVDIKSPMFLSDRKMNLWLSSDRHLNATFNPASLMSVGDALAFASAFQDPVPSAEAAAALLSTPSERQLLTSTSSLVDKRLPKAVATTVTTTGAVTSRAPQKYLIQNQSGMRVYYWAEASRSGSGRPPVWTLDNGGSETLRAAPLAKRITFMQSSSAATGAERLGSVINLHFEGNWMPICDVAVNVVGKYRYSMVSPADNTSVPVVVDIILVGRTKIITLHSGIWVENSIARSVSLRLHIPTTPLVPPPAAGGASASAPASFAVTDNDVVLGPLEPKSGCYLPLTAALKGRLFLRPEGYAEASRDVIRLGTDVDALLGQQGYVTCDALDPTDVDGPLHVAMEATPSRLLSEFQAFKHMECVAPGTIQRATSPLEVTISIQPTMVIANALPYEMRVLLWQVAPPETPSTPTKGSQGQKGRKSGKNAPPMTVQTPGTAQQASLLEMLSPRSSVAVPQPRRGNPGRYFCYSIPPGGEQDVHVDLRQNVLMHVSVEEINMRSTKWSLCSWAHSRKGRGDGRETQYSAKLPREVQLRLVGVGMQLPTDHRIAAPYLMRLKEAGALVQRVHKQFNEDARTAVSSEDVQAAVGRVKSLAKRMGKAGGKVLSRGRESFKAGGGDSKKDRPVPPRPRPAPPSAEGGVQKVKKRGGWLLGRRSSGGEAAAEAPRVAFAAAEDPPSGSPPRSASAGASSSAASPQRELLPARVPQSHLPEVELVSASPAAAAAPAVTATEFPVTVEPEAVSSPPPAAAAPALPLASLPPRPPRPPPLEISELPEPAMGPSPGMIPPTPFDVWAKPSGERAQPETKVVDDWDEPAEVRAPAILHVGVHNSLANQEFEQAGVCRITLFSPFWLNNRTGVDLFYQDHSSAPGRPLLCGAKLPGDFGEVYSPGTSMTEAIDRETDTASVAAGSEGRGSGLFQPGIAAAAAIAGGGSSSLTERGINQAVLEYKLVLMNKQDELNLGLAHVVRRRYSAPIAIKTVGNKGYVELRGPPARLPPTAASRVVQGLKGAAAPVTAVGRFAATTLLRPGGGAAAGISGALSLDSEVDAVRAVSRHSMTGDRVADVVATEPGTTIVRLTTKAPERPRPRAMPSLVRRPVASKQGVVPVADEDAEAALRAMQQLPPPSHVHAASHAALDAMAGGGVVGAAGALLTSRGGANAPASGHLQLPEDPSVGPTPETGQESGAAPSPMPHPQLTPDQAAQAQQYVEMAEAQAAAERQRLAAVSKGQRLFEFAVDVAAAPPSSIYGHTKLVTLKPKYIIENQTGLQVDVKQLGTRDPDSDSTPAVSARFARTLAPGQRAAVYWDDAELPKELVVRPRQPGEAADAFHWSGGFPIPDTEWYFGLRIRQAHGARRYLNIPVNVTVGSSGSVQVTLKSPASVPPYRIENMCKDVQLYFVQVPLVFREEGNLYVDSLQPSESMPYAWDEPTMVTKLRVQAKIVGRVESRVSDYLLDQLGDAPMMMLPTHGEGGSARRIYRTLSNEVPDELKKKLVSLLAAEFSKKVYVTVYADGPTRVLRFSDEKNISSLEQQHVVLDLAARLKQVESQLRAVNAQFSRLSGVQGTHTWSLDLYGRMPIPKDEPAGQRSTLTRRSSRRGPLPEATQALVQYASRHISTAARQARASSRDLTALGNYNDSLAGNSAGRETPSAEGQGLAPRTERRWARSVSFAVGEGPSRPISGVLDVPLREIHSPRSPEMEAPLPYRHLVIRTGSEAMPGASYQEASAELGMDEAGGAGPSEIEPLPVRRADSKDWGHITKDPLKGASSRSRSMKATVGGDRNSSAAAAAPGGGGGSGQPPATTLARRHELLRLMADGDAVLLIGGDLTVTVVQAKGLAGVARNTHPFARVRIQDPVPPPAATDERTKQTSVVWQTSEPVWDEQLMFRDVCAASELVVELWDLGGTRSGEQLKALVTNPQEVIKSCRYLGRAEVPLSETLDAPPGTPLWFPLARRSAGDVVSGELQLRFQWDVTARGLLSIKLSALERVLAQRREILAALQPVPARIALSWTETNPEVAEAPPATPNAATDASPTKAAAADAPNPAGFHLFGLTTVPNDVALGSLAPTLRPSRVAAEVLARHSHDHNRRHLLVTVLEARGLNPRRGVVVALSASELPNPVVTLSLPGRAPYTTTPRPHTLNPRWPADQRFVFEGVDPAAAAISVRLWDHGHGLFRHGLTLGEGLVDASHVRGENPTYVWVPMTSRTKRSRAAVPADVDAATELQVFLRLQWQTEVVRGSSLKVEIDAAGAGLMVVGGLQDELFNLTVDSARVTAVRTQLELQVEGSVAKIQLDNQMLDAVEPVVLAPDTGVKPMGVVAEGPLITFAFVRSYAGSSGGAVSGDADAALVGGSSSLPSGSAMERSASAASVSAMSDALTAGSVGTGGGGGGSLGDSRGIRSFKKVRLSVAPMDLLTDEAFLEALLSFVSSLPTADIWQDGAWQEQQRRLLAAQFGPREVEKLAVNAIVVPQPPPTAAGLAPGTGGLPVPGPKTAAALAWVLEKEARDLEALHGQSDLSSWFFLESAEVETVSVNVTVSLTSRLLSAGQQLTAQGASGEFNRALGASGFQLVNVSNVPITLGRWVAGNDPSIRGRFSNGFLSQRALASNLARHYWREGLKEAHKVLGGAGPAIASVPLAVLWASGSAVVLVREVTTGSAGFVGAVQQVFYLPMMTFSMVASALSRTFAAGMAAIPPHSVDRDDETLRRVIRRPNNAIEALAGAPKELMHGVINALEGMLMDPVMGWHEMRTLGFLAGSAKALIGLPVRPIIGASEFTSHVLAAVALASLGRQGIVGKIQRRVRAPGAYADDIGEAAMEDGPRSEAQAHARAVQAAWQRVLPEFFPEMESDTVTDVINVRSTRVVLVTNRHVAYLRARHLRDHSVYKAKWMVPVDEVQNIRGDPETRKITIAHVHRYDLKLFGVWPVQKRKGMRCGSRSAYERTVLRLTMVQQAVQGGAAEEVEGGEGFMGADVEEMTIMSAPYRAPSVMGRGKVMFQHLPAALTTAAPIASTGTVSTAMSPSRGARPAVTAQALP